MEPLAIAVADVAQMTGLSVSHLKKIRCYQPDVSPPFFRRGRRVLYPVSGVREWIDGRTAATQAELGLTS